MTEHLKAQLLQKERNRYAFLLAHYEIYSETGESWVRRPAVVERAGLSKPAADEAEEYLSGEGLIEIRTGSPEGLIELTHLGIVEIEETLRRPDSPTEH